MLITIRTFVNMLTARIKSERGATAVEYGLMVALIAAVIITAVALIGTNLDTLFDKVGEKIGTATPA